MTPEKKQQIEADAEALYPMPNRPNGMTDPVTVMRRQSYRQGATAEAEKAAALVEEKDKEIVRLSWLAAGYGWKEWAKEQGYEYDDYEGPNGGWVKRGIAFQNVLQWIDLREMFIKDKKLIIKQ